MAPQQNSTFIEDDSLLRSKLHSNFGAKGKDTEEAEIIERYSPIMPLMSSRLLNKSKENKDLNTLIHPQLRNRQPYRNELGETHQKYCQNYQKHFENDYENGNGNRNRNRNGNRVYGRHGQSRQTHRSRSISLHGANSTMEQGQKEISIWIGNEARYVSGVTKKTTCNDIIKALIDDEIQNGNLEFLRSVERQSTNTKDDGNGVCATSRDYSDYVIAECWRGIERSYDGDMTILPVWQAWSRVHNEVRLMLRLRSEIRDPIQQYSKPHQGPSLLRKYLTKLTRLWRKEKPKEPSRRSSTSWEMKENYLLSHKTSIPDELLFVLLPDKVYEKEQVQPGGRLQPIPEKQDTFTKHNQRNRLRSMRRNHKSTANRKRYERGVSGVSANDCIRRRQLTANGNSLIRSSVRYRLAQKTSEMDALYAREYELTRELREKCKLYRQQNQIYSNPDQQWNISIGQVQRKIENYAQEIVRTEHELLELKNEIKQDISLINNLKRMTLERGRDEDCKIPLAATDSQMNAKSQSAPTGDKKANKEMLFVDNIYEFCDKNASMLV